MNQQKACRNVDEVKQIASKIFLSIEFSFPVDAEKSLNRLENLSNELFYEIFEYLDGCAILRAFSNLNMRFENLLSCSSFPLKITLNDGNVKTMREHCEKIIVPNAHRLISLHLIGAWPVNPFFEHCTLDRSFCSLESLVLGQVSSTHLLMILFYLNNLPRLHSLDVTLEEGRSLNLDVVLRLIFALPTLKSLHLTTNTHWVDAQNRFTLAEPINSCASPIERFHLKHPLSLNEILLLLKYLPSIRHLFCDDVLESPFFDDQNKTLSLPHFRSLAISSAELKLSELETFLQSLGRTIEVFKIDLGFDMAYLDAERWQQMIRKHLPKLRIFDFYSAEVDFPDPLCVAKYVNPFNSTFWIERNDAIALEVNQFDMKFSVHSRK